MDVQENQSALVGQPIPEEQSRPNPPDSLRKFSFGKIISVVGAIVLLLGLAAGVYLSQKQQDTQQHASVASDVIGYLDNRTNPSTWCTAIYGWTCDRTNPSLPIPVHLYSPSPYVTGAKAVDLEVASVPSADEAAIAAFCGATTGNKKSYPHRFVLHIPDNLKNNKPIKIYVYGIGLDNLHNPLLVGSGTSVTCAPPSVTQAPTITSIPTSPSAALAGDSNHDGKIDLLDYNLLMSCYGKSPTGTCASSDLNKDGAIDGIDYNIFLRAFIQANQ